MRTSSRPRKQEAESDSQSRPARLSSELQALWHIAREIRRYDKDRLGYIERRRTAEGKNFAVDDENVIITDGRTARDILSGTDTTNVPSTEIFLRKDPIAHSAKINANWITARNVTQQFLRRKHARGHTQRVHESFDAHLRSLQGSTIDVVEAMQLGSGAIMSDLFLGADAAGIPALIQELSRVNFAVMQSSRAVPMWLPIPRVRRHRRVTAHAHRVLADITRRRIDGDAQSDDILQALLEDGRLADREVTLAVMISLLASFGVPGVAAAWSILALKQDPELEQAARAAAREVTDAAAIAEEAPLLVAIAHESLRLYPSFWRIGRIATEAFEVDGVRIARGTRLSIIVYSIHRDGAEWDAAEEFEPRRWLEPDRYRKGVFIPFGAGPRMCIGSHVGMTELVTMLWTYLRGYDLVDIDVDPTPTIRVALEPRRFTGRFVPS